MTLKRPFLFLFILFTEIIGPVMIIKNLYVSNYFTVLDYLITVLFAITGIFFIYYACYWEYTNNYLKNIYVFFSIIGIAVATYKFIKLPHIPIYNYESFIESKQKIIWLIIFIVIDIRILLSWRCREKPFKLSFPFKNGSFVIIDGGDGKKSFFTNYHYRYWKKDASMRYAADIIKMNKYGFYNTGYMPKDNNKYFIYNEVLYSPVDGKVIDVKNETEDSISHSGKYSGGLGNRIVIKKDNYYVVLGHLKKDSIKVSEGQIISKGDYLAKIGSTGYSPRPHLHMQVMYSEDSNYWQGKGVPIMFNNKIPHRNMVFKV